MGKLWAFNGLSMYYPLCILSKTLYKPLRNRVLLINLDVRFILKLFYMARFNKNGTITSLSGVIGNVVMVKGGVVRSKPQKSNKKPTVNEKENQNKFKQVSQFVKPIYDFMKVAFKDLNGKKNPRDAVRSYYLNHVVKEAEEGGYVMNYPKALMSTGRLRGMEVGLAELQGQNLTVSWKNNSEQAYAADADLLNIIAFDATNNTPCFFLTCALREDGQVTVTFPDYFSTEEVHLWASFQDSSGKEFANSDYLGVFYG
jgi:hypothetical protein